MALLVAFVSVAVLVERGSTEPPVARPAAAVSPLSGAATETSSVWYCAAGTARGSATAVLPPPAPPADVVAEHRLLITNAGDSPRRVRLTVYPTEGSTVRRDLDVRGHERLDVDVADLARAPFASALVEADGGHLAVAHSLRGPTGESTAPCSTTSSRAWYFAAGSTEGSTRQVLVLFNPFPQQVVVDVEFQATDTEGRQVSRSPRALEGLVVPAERPLAVDVTGEVAGRRQVSTRVVARDPNARLVVDRVLLDAGSASAIPFLSVAPGANAARSGWVFADGRPRRDGLATSFVVYNPEGDAVDVELRVRPDRFVAAAEPFRVTVRPGEFQEIVLDERVGADAGYWAVAVARSGGTFVIERVVRARAQSPPAPVTGGAPLLPAVVDAGGVTFTPGSPVLARDWIVPPAAAGGGAGLVAVTNVSDATVTLHVEAVVDGRSTPLAGYDGVTLGSGLRTTVDLAEPSLPGGSGARRSLRVRADGAIAAEVSLAPGLSRGVSDLLAVPVRDGLSSPFVEVLSLAAPVSEGDQNLDPAASGGDATPTTR